MEDFEKNRVTHVQQMEATVKHLRAEHDRYKAIAEKWEPVVTVQTDANTQKTKFGLRFGGKNVHATVSSNFLQEMDSTGATSQIVNALVESLVVEQLTKVIRPEVERAQQGANATLGAGKW
jgi:hypothetical protein